MTVVSTVAHLESIYGEQPPLTLAKSVTTLDAHCAAFLAQAPFAVLGLQDRSGAQHSLVVGGDPGVLQAHDASTLRLPGTADVVPDAVPDGAPAGLVALVSGYGETLRVNGRLRRDGADAVLDVDEAFLHCARCITRSKLWRDHGPSELAPNTVADGDFHHPDVQAFVAMSSFLTVSTTDGAGHGDVSPKGDERGFVAALGPRRIALPDRPGNRRTDTFRNLLDNPAVAVTVLVPGDERVLSVRGTAHVSADPALRASLRAGGAVPDLALVIDADRVDLRRNPALAAARLWHADRRIEKGTLPTAGQIWTDHVAAP